MEILRVVVIGGGTMGNGIAQVGYRVRMVDVSATALARALETISGNLDRLARKGVLDEADPAALVERIETETDAAQGVRDADLVVEAVPERAELKYELFRVLDAEAPANAVLASNTSSISITEIAARTSRPDRVIGMHFMNPVPVMQLVEVIRGLGTSDVSIERRRRSDREREVRLFKEVQAAGYGGGYGQVKRYVREVRPREEAEPIRRFRDASGPPGPSGLRGLPAAVEQAACADRGIGLLAADVVA